MNRQPGIFRIAGARVVLMNSMKAAFFSGGTAPCTTRRIIAVLLERDRIEASIVATFLIEAKERYRLSLSTSSILGPVHTISAHALRRENGFARGAKAKAGRAPGELLQRSAKPFSQQPEGNGRHGSPLFVALLAKTPGLCFVVRLDWRAMASVRMRGN